MNIENEKRLTAKVISEQPKAEPSSERPDLKEEFINEGRRLCANYNQAHALGILFNNHVLKLHAENDSLRLANEMLVKRDGIFTEKIQSLEMENKNVYICSKCEGLPKGEPSFDGGLDKSASISPDHLSQEQGTPDYELLASELYKKDSYQYKYCIEGMKHITNIFNLRLFGCQNKLQSLGQENKDLLKALADIVDATEDKGGLFAKWHQHLRSTVRVAKQILQK